MLGGSSGVAAYDGVMQITPIDADAEQIAAVKYTPDGLVPAIVQDDADGQVLMMAWMTDRKSVV